MTEQQQKRRIPKGTIIAEIPLEAAKAFPIRIWTGTGLPPKIAYADRNTHAENVTLTVKFLPEGAETAPHPQIVMYVRGMYHVEELSYNVSEPFDWTTWQEYHLNALDLQQFIDALYKAKFKMEAQP